MAIAFDGSRVPDVLDALPCGGIPEFDDGSGYAYRCNQCGAVVNSISMPAKCASALKARDSAQAGGAVEIFTPEVQIAGATSKFNIVY